MNATICFVDCGSYQFTWKPVRISSNPLPDTFTSARADHDPICNLFRCYDVRLACRLLSVAIAHLTQQNDDAAAEAASACCQRLSSTVQVAEPFSFELTVTAPRAGEGCFSGRREHLDQFDVVGHRDSFDIPAADDDQRTGHGHAA